MLTPLLCTKKGLVSLGPLLAKLLPLLALLKHLSLASEPAWGDEALEFWCNKLAWLDFTLKGELCWICLLVLSENRAKLVHTLRAIAAWDNSVCQALDIGFTALENDHVKSRDFRGDDTATDGLTLALTVLAWAVTGGAGLKEEANTAWSEDTLLHWEALLVEATTDAEEVSLELIAKDGAIDVLADALLVKCGEGCWIFNVNADLRAVLGVCEGETHFRKARPATTVVNQSNFDRRPSLPLVLFLWFVLAMSDTNFPVLQCMDPLSWDYLAEGFDSVILKFIGDPSSECQGKVLRLFKNQHEGHRRAGAEPLSDFREQLQTLLRFETNFIAPYLKDLDLPVPVTVTSEFIKEVAAAADKKRPASRVREGYICPTSTVACLHNNHISPGSLVVEIKPKWGFCPDCPLLPKDCVLRTIPMYQILQRTKLRKGDITSVSEYDPRDLFSGDETRVARAVNAMVASGQNIKVFRNGSKSKLTDEERCALAPLLARSVVLQELLAIQLLDLWDVQCLEPILKKANGPTWESLSQDEAVIAGIRKMMETRQRLPDSVAEVERMIEEMDTTAARTHIAAFLTSQSARDCSIMITFPDGVVHDPVFHAIDFDLKMPELLLSQYLRSEQNAIRTYLETEL